MQSRSRIVPRAGRVLAAVLLAAVLLAGGAIAAGGAAQAGAFGASAPSLFASVDGVGRWYDLTPTTSTLAAGTQWSVTTQEFDFSIGMDEFAAGHSWAMGVTNDQADPKHFSFQFTTSFLGINGESVVEGALEGECIDIRGDGMQVDLLDAETAIWRESVGDGPDFTDLFELGPSFSAPPTRGAPAADYAYGPYGYGPSPGPSGSWNRLRTEIDCVVSGYDEVRLVGVARIDEVSNPVPEPGTFALMGLGLSAALIARRKRK